MTPPQKFKGRATFAGEEISWSMVTIDSTGLIAESLNRSIESFIHTWTPRKRRAQMDLRAYVDLANARQCFQLAVAAQEGPASDMYRFACELERALGNLEKAHPRFAYPHSLAISAAQLIGELLTEGALDTLWELDAVLPKPISAPTEATTYIVVDDYQTTEDFQARMLPDPGALEVYVADGLNPDEFEHERRVVFDGELFSPSFAPFLAVDRCLNDGTIEFTISLSDTGEIKPWLMLRDLRSYIDAHFYTSGSTREVSAVEYYTELAFSASCTAMLMHHPRALAELTFRRRLLVELCASFAKAKKRNHELAPAHALASQALRACERMELDTSVNFVAPIPYWFPKNLRMCMPRNLDPTVHRELADELIFQLLGKCGGLGHVRVMDYQTSAEIDETGLPNRLRYDVEAIEGHLEIEHFAHHNSFIFTELWDTAGSCIT